MSELSSISRFRWLTVWLADNLVPEDVNQVRKLLKDQLNRAGTGATGDDILDNLVTQNRINDDDTELLRTLFISLGRTDLLEAVDDYEREKKAVVKRLKKNPSVLGGPYFGRQDTLNGIVGVLDTTYNHIHGVCITGEGGLGKTRIAQEACLRMTSSHKLVTIDLTGLKSMESVHYSIMHALGVECREYDIDNLYGMLRSYDCAQYGNTIILLDSANSLLNPGSVDRPNPAYGQFIKALKTIMSINNPRLKVIVTSRFDIGMKAGISSKTMSAFRLNQYNGLDEDAAMKMFSYHAGNNVATHQDIKNIANMCGKNPLVVKVVAKRLQDGTIQLHDLLQSSSQKGVVADVAKSMSQLKLAQNDRLQQCLQSTIDSLSETQKRIIIELSAISGSFSLEAARRILKYRKEFKKSSAVLQFDLQDLKYLGLLEIQRSETSSDQFSEKVCRYRVHQGIRTFIDAFIHSEAGAAYLKYYQKAQKSRFIRYYGEKLRNICLTLQVDRCSGLSQLRQDSANYLGFLEILKSAEDFKPSEDSWWVILAAEMLFSSHEAEDFFGNLAVQAKKRNDLHAFSDLRCYQIMQLKELGHDSASLLEQLLEVQDILNNKIDISEGIHSKQFSLATCYCLRGELLTATGKITEAVQWLQQAVSLRKQILTGAGNDGRFLIARALNSLGVAMKKQAGAEKTAKTCFLQAYEMCRQIANGSDKHFDTPRFVVNIGDILRELGQHEDAIECMKRSLELERALGMGASVAVCSTQENIAMSYCAMERFADAIPIAKQCMENRKKLSGPISPQTAHASYLLGSMYVKARNLRQARSYFDEALVIEEGLWARGLPHSDDWEQLKTSLETMMVTLQKSSTLVAYRKRFQDAEKAATKGKVVQKSGVKKVEIPESDDSSSQSSSIPSEISDDCPVRPRPAELDSDSDVGSIDSEIDDDLPAPRKPVDGSSDEESLPSEMSDGMPAAAARKGIVNSDEDDDETSSNSSSIPSEISDGIPVRVDRNLNYLNKNNNVATHKKQCPSGSGDSAVEGSLPSSDEMPHKEQVH